MDTVLCALSVAVFVRGCCCSKGGRGSCCSKKGKMHRIGRYWWFGGYFMGERILIALWDLCDIEIFRFGGGGAVLKGVR